MQNLDLPEPTAEQQQHSERLCSCIRQLIDQAGGWISFESFMQAALYTPGLGYYSAGQQKFGEQGDFITSPEVGPLFARTLARPVAGLLGDISDSCIIEFGAGSGKLAAELLAELQLLGQLPEKYFIIELSAELQQRQQRTIERQVPDLLPRVEWLSALPQTPLNAVVLANEVLDAMPVRRFCMHGTDVQELGVSVQQGELQLSYRDADEELQQQVAARVPQQAAGDRPYCSEINRYIRPWIQALEQTLVQGAVLLIDYGYPREEYYAEQRHMGTFMGYYRHRALDDPLWYPGLQDLTAFVDFTEVAEAALASGFDVDGFTSQGNFLVNCGLTAVVEQVHCESEVEKIQLLQQMKTLSLPGEMGERFKVLALSRGLEHNVPGFELRDQRYRL